MWIFITTKSIGLKGNKMASEVPETIKIVQVLANTWQYFAAGLFSLAGIVAIVKKGKNTAIAIIPLSETHIDNKMKMCAGDLKEEIRDEFKDELKEMKEDMLREIGLMIKASIK